jgi:hypothetical protein
MYHVQSCSRNKQPCSKSHGAFFYIWLSRYPCILQPILQIMLEKASQAHSQHSGLPQLMFSDSGIDDELSAFVKTGLIHPEQPFTSPVLAPLRSQAKLTHSGQFGIYPQLSGSLDHPLVPHEPLASKPVVLPDSYLDNYQATFADLSGGWDGLFHEVPQPSYTFTTTSHTMQPSGEGTMLDDRWGSFMHNYSILMEPSLRQNAPC